MKNFIETIQNIWKIEELRNKILLTLGLMAVYRFMAQIPLPGIDPTQLSALENQADGGLLGLLNAFTGGAFSRASIMALGIMPYISASIVVQLMGIAVPYLQKLQKDGESGRKKITQWTRFLTIGICLAQAPSYIATSIDPRAIIENTPFFWITSTVLLITGTMFVMWLGERITDKGLGNGISLLIMIGIIANFPTALVFEFQAKNSAEGLGLVMFLVELVFL